jgi:hypothetical protein
MIKLLQIQEIAMKDFLPIVSIILSQYIPFLSFKHDRRLEKTA